MIFGNVKTYRACGMSTDALDKYIELLKTIKADAKPGKYELDNGAYYIVSDIVTQGSADEKVFESHEKYIDIQYVFEGTEGMEYADTAELTVTAPYDESIDAALYKGKGIMLNFKAGDFAVFSPMDGHKPGCGSDTSRKVIVKVPVK